MSCQDLQTTIIELARGQITDAALRDEALLHTASCARCSMQLEDQRTLSAGLKQVAAVTLDEQASSGVEANLLTRFSEQRVASSALARSIGVSRWIYVGAGVAALIAIVVLLSLTVFRATERQHNVQAPENHSAAGPNSTERKHEAVVQPLTSGTTPEKTNPPKPSLASNKTKGGTRLVKADQSASEPEIATDFFPLMNRELTQLESGQVVRVELPRSALMSFGLPMNMDRANERIKADVVVGNDGLARAIRFVR